MPRNICTPRGPLNGFVRPVIYVIGPSICYVSLANGLFSLIETWDAAVVERINWAPSFCPKGKRFYVYGNLKVSDRPAKYRTVPMHRLLMGFPTSQVDHRNGNSLDNRRHGNLRPATSIQNQANGKVRADNKSGFKGVIKRKTKFVAHIRLKGVRQWIGTFDTAEAAHAAYIARATELHGEFARFG